MKKRISALILALLLCAALLCGCGSKGMDSAAYESAADEVAYSSAAQSDAGYWEEAAEEAPMPAPAQEAGAAGQNTEAKMIYTAQLELETTGFDQAVEALAALTAQCGGYYEQSAVNDWGGSRHADYTIRVPVGQYRAFLTQAGRLCHVLSVREQAEDVSEVYYDTSGRLETQKTKQSRLQQLLKQAENMEDIIAIESAISETQEMIDMLSGEIRHYDALVDYSTVTVNLSEVYKLSNVEEPPAGFGSRIASAFGNGWRSFLDGMEDILVASVHIWPWLVVIAAIVIPIAAVKVKKSKKRRAAKHPAGGYSTPEEKQEDGKTP